MSPQEFKDKAIDVSGNTRVTLPLYVIVILLGFRYLPQEGEPVSPDETLIYKMDTMLSNQAKDSQIIRSLEISVSGNSNEIKRNTDDIKDIKNMMNRSTSWPGEMGGTP